MRRQKVLIVDDDPAVTAVYEVAFQLERFDVAVVNSGSAAFSTLRTFKPDAVVLDLNMPGIDGLHWMKAVRQVPDFRELPIVILTSSPPESPQVVAALEAGVKGVLTKNQWGAESVTEAVKWALYRRPVPVDHSEEPNWAQAPR